MTKLVVVYVQITTQVDLEVMLQIYIWEAHDLTVVWDAMSPK
jgi:hypothetical protein